MYYYSLVNIFVLHKVDWFIKKERRVWRMHPRKASNFFLFLACFCNRYQCCTGRQVKVFYYSQIWFQEFL